MMDYVLPYVDGSDPVWREQYRQMFSSCKMDESRYRSFGTLRYAFRSVAKNMPFIDRIVLIVSTESQVPAWVNRDTVRIVTHDEFMPENHLPTFSSSAIESDMWRIDGLSDCFVYGNDDFFVLRPLTRGDFFLGDVPRLNFSESDFHARNIFRWCCRNGMDMVADVMGVERTDQWILIKPHHCMKGIVTAHMKELGRRCEKLIEPTITVMRHRSNVTGYIYHYQEYYSGNYAPFKACYRYVQIKNDFGQVESMLKDPETDVLCINDAGELNKVYYYSACNMLQDTLDRLFPDECKYENKGG